VCDSPQLTVVRPGRRLAGVPSKGKKYDERFVLSRLLAQSSSGSIGLIAVLVRHISTQGDFALCRPWPPCKSRAESCFWRGAKGGGMRHQVFWIAAIAWVMSDLMMP
jgi:hypothetical protein